MPDKKTRIIEASIELFAKQGYHTTSVQQIAQEAGVAKGSFYNYFDSKDQLILSIYEYYSDLIQDQMASAKAQLDDPREALKRQLDIFFDLLRSRKSLIIMLLQGQVTIEKDIEKFIHEARLQNFKWVSENLTAIYGDDLQPYLNDSVLIFNGMLHSYATWVVSDEEVIQTDRLTTFLLKRLDDLCLNLISSGEEPIIQRLPDDLQEKDLAILEIEKKLKNHPNEDETIEKATDAVHVLKKELKKDDPESIIIQSMLQLIEKIDDLQDEAKQIRRLIE